MNSACARAIDARRLVTVLVLALCAACSRQEPPAGPVPPGVLPPGIVGAVDSPNDEVIAGSTVRLSGWALDPAGIDRVDVRLDGESKAARYGIAREDVARVKPGYPDSLKAGFEFSADFAGISPERHEIAVVAVSRAGGEAVLTRKSLVPPLAMAEWKPLHDASTAARASPFSFLIGSSGVGLGGAAELDTAYRPYLSPTVQVGLRVPILYLRTTRGAAEDWRFDPDWNVDRRCRERRIADDSLSAVIAHSIAHQLPVLFTLNGGIWADASCDVPEWDANDHLEQDRNNCQWNEHDEVAPDDALKHLPGGLNAPELGRSLTFNVYAKANRAYKRRNLQAAGRIIAAFGKAHPELFAGINLDPDTYLNPFFEERQWYDYNPGTLRQFRHWLAGSGPYARNTAGGVPDLSRYRRAHPLTLAQAGKLAGKRFARWSDVDPPRVFPRGEHPFWKDPWVHEWEVFRRHLVDLHYDELSLWLHDAGVPAEHIFSSQGFMAPAGDALPFAVTIESPSKNYDTGGMSIEGAIPRDGHLGAIVYGPSAVNDIRMETRLSLFATFRRMDPGWAVVEFNTADLRDPKALPGYAAGYRALRDMFNYGATFASPMAWNGSNGIYAGQPGYVPYMAWRNTPLEDAMRDFAVSHAYVPLGARLWTFGSARHADDDGWSAADGSTMVLQPGRLVVRPAGAGVTLLSPPELDLRSGRGASLVIASDQALTAVGVDAEDRSGKWWTLVETMPGTALSTTSAGWTIPLSFPSGLDSAERLKVRLRFADGLTQVSVRHIALYPR